MSFWVSAVGTWIADYYLLATLTMMLAWLAMRLIRQPVRRLGIAWSTIAGLLALAIISGTPNWPRVAIFSLPAEAAMARTPAQPAVGISAADPRPSAETPDLVTPYRPSEAIPEPPGSDNPPAVRQPRRSAVSADRMARQRTAPSPTSAETSPPPVTSRAWNMPPWRVAIGALFVAGALQVCLWLTWGAVQAARLCRRSTEAPEQLETRLRRIVGGNRRPPRLLLSPDIDNAVVLGVLRPTILLPAAPVEQDGELGWEAVLAHEAAHVRNGDLWLLAAGRLMLLLLFAHPLFWWLRRRIRTDQEAVADETAAAHTGREVYAEGLVAWARTGMGLARRHVPAALAIREGTSQLEARIATLLDESLRIETRSPRPWKLASLAITGTVVLTMSVLTLQPARSADPMVASPSPANAATGGLGSEDIEDLERLGIRVNIDQTTGVTRAFIGDNLSEEAISRLKELNVPVSAAFFDSDETVAAITRLTEFSTVETLSISGGQLPAAAMPHLKKLTGLRRLLLRGGQIDDAAIHNLAELPQLEYLGLHDRAVTERGLEVLGRLPNLQSFSFVAFQPASATPGSLLPGDSVIDHLASTTTLKSLSLQFGVRITDAGFARLSRLPKLEELKLGSADITDEGLAYIGKITSLKTFELQPHVTLISGSRSRLTDVGLRHLKGLTNLEVLSIPGGQFTDAGMAHLAGMTKLKRLTLISASSVFSDEGFKAFVGMNDLEWLFISGKLFVTDAGLAHLKNKSKLVNLFLGNSQITDAGLVHLQNKPSLAFLHLNETDISDAGLEHLQSLTGLRNLNLRGTRVAGPGLADLKGLSKLSDLDLSDTRIDDKALKELSGFSGLARLNLQRTAVSDEAIARLQQTLPKCRIESNRSAAARRAEMPSRIPSIQSRTIGSPENVSLSLRGPEITDDTLANLESLRTARSLSLSETAVTDAGLAHLKQATQLRTLSISQSRITGAGLVHLASLPELTDISLFWTDVNDEALVHLTRLKKLERLSLSRAPITDAGLVHLGELGNLRSLSLRDTRVGDDGLRHLRGLSRLFSLGVSGNDQISDVGLVHIRNMTNLAMLDLDGTRVTDSGLENLAGLPNLTSLSLRDTAITDSGLVHLSKLTRLIRLTLDHTRVTEAGIRNLWRALPEATITPAPPRPAIDSPMNELAKEGTAAALKQLGITFISDETGQVVGAKFFSSRFEDADLAYLKGVEHVKELEFYICMNFTDAALGQLGGFEELQKLRIRSCEKITDAGLTHLNELPNLIELELRDCKGLTDAGLATLRALPKLEILRLSDRQATNKGLAELNSLKNLQELAIHGTLGDESRVNDAALAHIAGFTTLKRLSITSIPIASTSEITDAGLAHLGRLVDLEELTLQAGNRVTDTGLQPLNRLSKLRLLNLSYGQPGDAGFAVLGQLTSLEDLVVSAPDNQSRISDAGLARLIGLKNLRRLILPQLPAVSDDGLQSIGKLAALEDLTLNGSQITDAGLSNLAHLTHLKSLSLSQTPGITGSGLVHLQGATGLEKLTLAETAVQGRELQRLTAFPGLVRLALSGAKISDADLEPLTKLKNLEVLALRDVDLSPSALELLQRALPKCRIMR